MVNINAMRAIVKHNVFKQLKQLSKSDQTKIIKKINPIDVINNNFFSKSEYLVILFL